MTEAPNTVYWQLGALLARHNLTAYRLAQQLDGKMNAGSVYTLAKGGTERVSLTTLGHLLGALEELTGTRYSVADLLAYHPATPTPGSAGGAT